MSRLFYGFRIIQKWIVNNVKSYSKTFDVKSYSKAFEFSHRVYWHCEKLQGQQWIPGVLGLSLKQSRT